MKSRDLLSLLPPLPSLSEVAQAVAGDTSGNLPPLEVVTLTEDELAAALRSVPAEMPEPVAAAFEKAPATPPVFVQRGPETAAPIDEEALACYLGAAALRYTYRVDALTPVAAGPQAVPPARYGELHRDHADAVFAHLTGCSEIVADPRGTVRWMLRDEERRASLAKLIERGVIPQAVEQARADAAAETHRGTSEADGVPEETARAGSGRLEETLWSYLSGNPPPLEAQDGRQLLLTQQVSRWLHGIPGAPPVPSPEDVARQLVRETMLQPFRHLTGEWKDQGFVSYFTGRETELQHLYDYLSVLPPRSVYQQVGRFFSGLVDSAWGFVSGRAGKRPLLIHGPGGVGKSTLLAKLLLDHLTETAPRDRFPYAYLDFDLSALSPREPVTLLAEAARQLAAQYPGSQAAWSAARRDWLEAISRSGSSEVSPQERVDALDRFASLLPASRTDEAQVAEQLARGLPFLLVFDTFEEVQYHDRDAVKDIFRFLNELREHVPALRVILMGRAPLADVREEFVGLEAIAVEGDLFGSGAATDFDTIEVPLGDLDPERAQEVLIRQGVSDPRLAEELVEIIGGNPLGLRLIARVLRDGETDLRSLRQEMQWRPTLPDRLKGRKIPPRSLLQGVLFRRILGHIHDKKVQALAHPGLILRRITPELIREVLAEPCGLAPLASGQEQTYFDALAREVSLVGSETEPQGEQVLRHRPELRRIMLRLMEADEDRQASLQEVHERAARFYEARSDTVAREEALYHRLMLGELPRPAGLLDDIPTEEAVEAGYATPPAPLDDPRPAWRSLATAVDELPPAAGTWLAARLHRDLVRDAAWETADPRDRELFILGRASRRAREHSSVISALESLRRDRDKMTGGKRVAPLSPLPLIEIALLERLGRSSEALDCATEALQGLRSDADSFRRSAEYNLLAARVAARKEDRKRCERFLGKALEAIDDWRRWAGLQAAIPVCRCERQFLRVGTDCYSLGPSPQIFEQVTGSLLRLSRSTEELKEHPTLIRYVVGFTCSGDPKDLPDLSRFLEALESKPELLAVLLRRIPRAATARVATALAAWTDEVLRNGVEARTFVKAGRLPQPPHDLIQLRDYWRKRLIEDPDQLADQLAGLFGAVPISPPRLLDLLRSLRPERRAAGEDPFEEACRVGDLMPGEGPPAVEREGARKARPKR